MRKLRFSPGIISLLLLVVYVAVTKFSISDKKGYDIPPLKFLFPASVFQMLTFGDPYLAANINYSRVVTLFHYSHDNAEPRAVLLAQSADLNAKHVDNMYQAAVIPFEGYVDSGIYAVQKSADARYWDWKPLFMVGMTLSNFKSDHERAANVFKEASIRTTDPKRKDYLKTLAANTYAKGGDLEASHAYIVALLKSVKQEDRRTFLEGRAMMIATLLDLRNAADIYEQKYGEKLSSLDQLITSGILEKQPDISIGKGFALDKNGRPQFYETVHASDSRK